MSNIFRKWQGGEETTYLFITEAKQHIGLNWFSLIKLIVIPSTTTSHNIVDSSPGFHYFITKLALYSCFLFLLPEPQILPLATCLLWWLQPQPPLTHSQLDCAGCTQISISGILSHSLISSPFMNIFGFFWCIIINYFF